MTTHQPLGYSSGLDQQGSAWIISRRPPRNLPPRWRPSVNKLGASASIRRPSGWRIRGETESISSGLKRPQTKVSRMRRIFFFFKMVTERRQRRHIYTVKLITDDVVMSMSTFLFIQASSFKFFPPHFTYWLVHHGNAAPSIASSPSKIQHVLKGNVNIN